MKANTNLYVSLFCALTFTLLASGCSDGGLPNDAVSFSGQTALAFSIENPGGVSDNPNNNAGSGFPNNPPGVPGDSGQPNPNYPNNPNSPPNPSSPGNTLQYSLTDQRTEPSSRCMTFGTNDFAANGLPNGAYGQPCSYAGQTVYIHWGTTNNALDYITRRPNTCPAGQGPVAVNTYTCVYCPSGRWADQYYAMNNGDLNFQGAYQDVRRRVCLP